MYHATLERKERFPRTAVILILQHGVLYALFCQLVLQLERNDGQTVDKDAQIQREFPGVRRIAELARHAENILSEQFRRLFVSLGRRHIKHHKIRRIRLDAVPQYVDDAAFRQFALQAVQKLPLFLVGFQRA